MNKKWLATTALVSITALVGCRDAVQPVIDDTPLAQQEAHLIPNHYIVVFNDAVADPPGLARALAVAHDLELRHTYAHALKGFAAVVPAGRLAALRADPRVRYVAPDELHQVHLQGPIPTGIDRIDADSNESITPGGVDADIAILDTGVDTDHPDLNVYRVVSFAGGSGEDGLGHGTHVAGIAAALDDGAGVVGVAPGARIWAVKVCNNGGSCALSDIIAGIDYVAQHWEEIDVANMSLGGRGPDDGNCGHTNEDPEHQAICAAVDSGVVFVVSAGNGGNASNLRPASYDEVITVSALADFDGKPGHAGVPTCRDDEDDSFANFSSFGPDVDLMAPGVCIESTWKQGGYNIISGTSMAAPHVTGTVALFVAANGRDLDGMLDTNATDVDLIKSALVNAGTPLLSACGLSIFDDRDSIPEPIVFANATNVGGNGRCEQPPPDSGDIAVTALTAPDTAAPGQVIDVTVTVKNVTETNVSDDIYVVLASDNATPDVGDDIPLGGQTITGGLAPDSATDLVFSWNTVGVNVGNHTLKAMHALNDANAANNSLTTVVTMDDNALPTVHVGNLDRASDKGGANGTWRAWVRITVHDTSEASLQGAQVSGTWSAGAVGTASCTTLADGTCEVSYAGLSNQEGNVVFRVDDIAFQVGQVIFVYDEAQSHDPDANSDGKSIRVFKTNSDDYKK